MNALTPIRNLALIAAFALPAALFPAAQAHAAAPVIISVTFGPPALPVYAQPICPDEGYIWTPGYWAYDDQDGYYWVPGTWVLPPEPGLLWTPGYWGWDDNAQAYVWNEGYWAPEVGFYGGVNYGFGYEGDGFDGGYWQDGYFFYNTRVARIGMGFGHIYDRPVRFPNHTTISFNGGRGGLNVRPTSHDLAAIHDHHLPPTETQRNHQGFAGQNHDQFAKYNNGRPSVPAASSANSFHDHPSDPKGAARPPRGNYNQPQPNQPGNGNSNNRMDRGGTVNQPQPNSPPQPNNQQRPNNQPHPQDQVQPQAPVRADQPGNGSNNRMDRGGTTNEPRPNSPQPNNQPRPNNPPQQAPPRTDQPHPQTQPQPHADSHPAPQPHDDKKPDTREPPK